MGEGPYSTGSVWRQLNLQEKRRGYTLLEILTSVAILGVILALLFSTTGMASLAWRENSNATDTFQRARGAFSVMTQRLGQATLNSYRDAYDTQDHAFVSPGATSNPVSYRYRSELNFVCGRAVDLIPDEAADRITHTVFFQAPLGYQQTTDPASRAVLNQCGYYVEWGSDEKLRPAFTASSTEAAQYRYRLYEVLQPSEKFELYRYPAGGLWLKNFTSTSLASCTRVLAENIVALILLPQRRQGDISIAPKYAYNSRAWQSEQTALSDQTQNQLPPLLQVTMVVIDEASARRMASSDASGNLVDASLFQVAANYETDMQALQDALKDQCRYRIFQTAISLPSSSWSDDSN